MEIPFYKKLWFVWLMLFIFPPVGVILMWKQKKFSNMWRIIISVVFGLITISALSAPPVDKEIETLQVVQEEPLEEIVQAEIEEEIIQEPEKEIIQEIKKTDLKALIHFIDVGQGDSIFIDLPDQNILIDGGDRNKGALQYLRSLNVSQLDIVVGTHAHSDHIGGLIEVLNVIPTKEVIDPGVVHTTKTFEDYLTIIEDKNIKFTEGRVGDFRDLGNGIQFKILHPKSPSSRSLNDSSVVVKLVIGEVSFLFTGDAETQAEQEMLRRGHDLKSTILKVGHHGSRTSSTDAFINAVSPQVSVIQVGAGNKYGHPNTDVIERFIRRNIQVYRTDLHGTIVISTDGRTFDVNSTSYTPPPVAVKDATPQVQSIEKPVEPIAGKININTATLEELMNIKHINEVRGKELIKFRPFNRIDDLTKINGIGPARLRDIKEQGLAYVE
jgi:competence protein ComEC